MAFRDSEAEAEEKYWNPKEIGDSIEGNLFAWLKDQYGNKIAVFDCVDEDGNEVKFILPSHKNLRRFYKGWKIGDYIRVELVDLQSVINQQYKKRIYKALIDDDRFREYNEE